MRAFVIMALVGGLTSCGTYRHYVGVAKDPVVDAREMVLLAQKYKSVFPETKSDPVLSGTGIDSSLYNEAINTQNLLIDELLAAYATLDSLSGLGSTKSIPCNSLVDSLRHIKGFLKKYKPPAIYIHDTLKVEVESSSAKATIQLQTLEITGLRAENAQLMKAKDNAESKLQKKNANMGWYYGGSLLAVIIAFVTGRFIRKT